MISIHYAWCRETSSDPENWTPENPAWGQCAVTALVIQDLLGGKLMRTLVDDKISHYWNQLFTGILDLTWNQFPSTARWGSEPPVERTREYVLSFPETERRYELLKKKIYGSHYGSL